MENTKKNNGSFRSGLLYGFLAYGIWGILPLYWRLLIDVGPLQILAARILGSVVFVSLILFVQRKRRWLEILRDPGQRLYLMAASLVVTINWGAYIFAVNTGHGVEASLGYYICPLVSIILGLVFLKEKMLPLQWVSFFLAAVGVFLMAYFNGKFPWISLLLAVTFGLYGFFKKKITGGDLEALGAETLLASPAAVILLFVPAWGGTDYGSLGAASWVFLLGAGVVTAAPLFWFSKAAKALPLAVIGFLQFINPTILFFMGVFLFGEPFSGKNLGAFVFIWLAVILFCLAPVLRRRGRTAG